MNRFVKKRGGRSFNRILFLYFFLFAAVTVSIAVTTQSVLLKARYRARLVAQLRDAGAQIEASMREGVADGEEMIGIYRRFGVEGGVFFADGTRLYASGEYFDFVTDILTRTNGASVVGGKILSSGNWLVYVSSVEADGQEVYLFAATTQSTQRIFDGSLWFVSLLTAVPITVLAFCCSMLAARFVTKPVVEVTGHAKALAEGKFDFDLKRDYACKEMNELSVSLDCARREISKTDKMQKELIANVSHDFKTPLTMIKAYASMILEISGDDKEKRDRHAQIIIDETDRLASLVGDLLDLSQLRTGTGMGERTVFNLSEELYSVVGRFETVVTAQGYTLETHIEDELYVHANRTRIGQVFYNLIGNAVNYTGEDKRVTIRLLKRDGRIRFEVEDTGKGISEGEISTIWERYYRSSETHKRPVQGTGLGLSIVKGILEAHEYPFGVQSEENKGSCFWVEFFPPPPENA